MKTSDLQKYTTEDLLKMIKEKQEELRKARFGTAGSGMRDTNTQRNLRREIAQALTELNGRNTVA